jgi:hypothetical protein
MRRDGKRGYKGSKLALRGQHSRYGGVLGAGDFRESDSSRTGGVVLWATSQTPRHGSSNVATTKTWRRPMADRSAPGWQRNRSWAFCMRVIRSVPATKKTCGPKRTVSIRSSRPGNACIIRTSFCRSGRAIFGKSGENHTHCACFRNRRGRYCTARSAKAMPRHSEPQYATPPISFQAAALCGTKYSGKRANQVPVRYTNGT